MSTSSDQIRVPQNCYDFSGFTSKSELMMLCHQSRKQNSQLFSRKWTNLSSYQEGPELTNSFRVMQFNALAEGLSADPDNTPYFSKTPTGDDISLSTFGNFDEVENPKLVFDYHGFRCWGLLEEILLYDSCIIAIQELDHFHDFFEPALRIAGYEGVFQPKSSSPSLSFGYYSDGVALFWKKSQFSVLSVTQQSQPCAYITVVLSHSGTNTALSVSTTHLKAKKGSVTEERRVQQIQAVLESIPAMEGEEGGGGTSPTGEGGGGGVAAVVVAGDFNAEATSDGGGGPSLAVPEVRHWRDGALRSAYPLEVGGGLEEGGGLGELTYAEYFDGQYYSTWKCRGGSEARRVIDYIFHSHKVRPYRLLDPPSIEEVLQINGRFPSVRYPSDHVAIVVDFQLVLD